MDEHEITNRLAITNLDFDSVNLSTIFRIFESVIGPSIVRISLFGTERSQQYAIAEFTDKRHAKDAYDSIDGLEIEATGNIFDLSFVPADFKGDTLLDDCSNPCGYENTNKANKRCSMDESLIQLSDELETSIHIPDEFKTWPEEKTEGLSLKKQIISEDSSAINISKTLKNKEHKKEPDDFGFDIKDSRFQSLFDDDDFIIDASNKKSKQQQVSRMIIEERQKRRCE